MPADPPSPPALRASDADRDRVIELLCAAELLTINERHGPVRRDGRWTLPHRLSVRHTRLAISRDAGGNTPQTLCVRLAGRMRHGRIGTRWLAPRR